MKILQDDSARDVIILYGVSGWSTYMFASYPVGYQINQKLIDFLDSRIPQKIKDTHEANKELKWINVYRLESTWKRDESRKSD